MPKNTVKPFEDWVHLKITEKELSEQLDAMVSADDLDRSKFVRRLIRQEFARRQQPHWVNPIDQPVMDMRIVSAETAVVG